MVRLELRLDLSEDGLLDASDDLGGLLDRDAELCPPLRRLLFAVDDAISDAFEAHEPGADR